MLTRALLGEWSSLQRTLLVWTDHKAEFTGAMMLYFFQRWCQRRFEFAAIISWNIYWKRKSVFQCKENMRCHWSPPTHLWKNRACSVCSPSLVHRKTMPFLAVFKDPVQLESAIGVDVIQHKRFNSCCFITSPWCHSRCTALWLDGLK